MTLVIAGVDEAGRGPLAGPVYAAAVILNPDKPILGLTDSKLLSEKQRRNLSDMIKACALDWSLGCAEVQEIESLNILQATLLAMQRAVAGLKVLPQKVLVDGNCCPKIAYKVEAIVGGDLTIPAISAASILAKVERDAQMIKWDTHYPGYGFAQHKGYGTKLHLAALQKLGPTPLHRKNFAPVKAVSGKK